MTKFIHFKPIILAIVFFGSGFFLGQSLIFTTTQSAQSVASIKSVASVSTFMIDYGDRVAYFGLDVPVVGADNVFDLTKQLTAQQSLAFEYDDSSELGVFIKRIGEQTNGEDNKFWQYRVNDTQPMVAADKYQVKNGDRILWRFVESVF